MSCLPQERASQKGIGFGTSLHPVAYGGSGHLTRRAARSVPVELITARRDFVIVTARGSRHSVTLKDGTRLRLGRTYCVWLQGGSQAEQPALIHYSAEARHGVGEAASGPSSTGGYRSTRRDARSGFSPVVEVSEYMQEGVEGEKVLTLSPFHFADRPPSGLLSEERSVTQGAPADPLQR